jgi:hypothetical protein
MTKIRLRTRRQETKKTPNRIPGFAPAPATVHCWSENFPGQTFRSLEKALAYCKQNIDELSAMEVFVHSGHTPEPIIRGEKLEQLVRNKVRRLS